MTLTENDFHLMKDDAGDYYLLELSLSADQKQEILDDQVKANNFDAIINEYNARFQSILKLTKEIKQLKKKYEINEDAKEISINKMFKKLESIPTGHGQDLIYYECQVCYCLFPHFQIQIHRKKHVNFKVIGELDD